MIFLPGTAVPEEILAVRKSPSSPSGNDVDLLIKWKGYDFKHRSWQPEEDLREQDGLDMDWSFVDELHAELASLGFKALATPQAAQAWEERRRTSATSAARGACAAGPVVDKRPRDNDAVPTLRTEGKMTRGQMRARQAAQS